MDKGKVCTLQQKIEGLDSDLIVNEVFVPNTASSSEVILGPCFRDGFPSDLVPFYPLSKGEKLLLHSVDPEWLKRRPLRSWPHLSRSWIHWVDRLEKVKGETWRTAGIYDAIQLSKIDIPFDRNLLYASLCFWSISSNSFHFNFGMMGPTVLDIVALTGLRPHGEEISAILRAPKSTFSLPKEEKKLRYGNFLEISMKRGDVTEDEHISFLIMWLCKYVFCTGSVAITKGCTQLAIALAAGRKLALAPFVLSHLYRGCRDLVLKRFGNTGGPFWILQLWLQSYFPEYGPLTNHSQSFPSYGVPLAQGKLRLKSFEECFKFFYSCSSRTASQFTPFSSWNHGPEWLRLSLHHHCQTSSKQELSDIWSSYLIARDLHYGLVLDTSVLSKAGVEYYSPNQFARQFGMIQAVPVPPYQSANTSLLDRIVFHSVNCIQDVDSRFVHLKKKLSAVHFDANPKCTPSFEFWWLSYIGKTRTESAEEVFARIFPSTSLIQEHRNFQPENSEQATKKRRNEEYIPQQPESEGREKDERPVKKAERELVLAGFPDIIADNMPKSAISITKQSPAVLGSNHSSAEAANSRKSFSNNVVLSHLTSTLLSDEDDVPLSCLWKTSSKASVGGDISNDQTKVGEVEDFFDRVTTQLQHAQSPEIDVKPALRMAQHSAQLLNKTKLEVQKLLVMPLHEVFLPENYSSLLAALPIYAASPHLSIEKAQALEELGRNLPSLFSDFQKAKKQKEDCSKVAKMEVLIDELNKGKELYNDLKLRRSKIDSQISELKDSLKEAKMKRRVIQEQEVSLKNNFSAKLDALQELQAESLDPQKELADYLITKQRLVGQTTNKR